jgi:hypothetical protein
MNCTGVQLCWLGASSPSVWPTPTTQTLPGGTRWSTGLTRSVALRRAGGSGRGPFTQRPSPSSAPMGLCGSAVKQKMAMPSRWRNRVTSGAIEVLNKNVYRPSPTFSWWRPGATVARLTGAQIARLPKPPHLKGQAVKPQRTDA